VGVLNQPESASDPEFKLKLVKNNEQLKLASLTQVPIIHYKGNDPQKVIFDAIYLNSGATEMRAEYATFKNMKLEIDAMYFSSLTHILDKALIMESSISIKENEVLLLKSDYVLPIDKKYVIISKKNQELLSTKFIYRYRLDIDFKNEEKIEEVDSKLLKNYASSFGRALSFSRLKMLMIQSDLDVLTQLKEPMSKYPYLIRYLTKFSNEMKLIQNFRPHIISVELSSVPQENNTKEQAEVINEEDKSIITMIEIESLIQIIKRIEGYDPVIEIFNCSELTDELKKKFNYPLLLTSTSKMSFELLLNMLAIFKSKRKEEDPYKNDSFIDSNENPIAIYALHKESRLKHDIPIKITSLSEHEITFITPIELPLRGVLFTKTPVQFYFTITKPIDSLERSRDGFHYFALINGISPTDAQELRQFVNMLFFKDKSEKKKQELEAFQALNKQKESEKKSSKNDSIEIDENRDEKEKPESI
jgi:hypothetical protein